MQSEKSARKEEQAYEANYAGRSSASKVNLEPFLDGKQDSKKKELI